MVKFIKMHGTGNDFVIIDFRKENKNISGIIQHLDYKKIANRKTGIGCDQIIILVESESDKADCCMHIYNADGSKVEMCGNAARCVGDLIMKDKGCNYAIIELSDRLLKCSRFDCAHDTVQVDMGIPRWEWEYIPLTKMCDTLNLPIKLEMLQNPVCVNMGNTHAVFFVNSIKNIPLERLGPILEVNSIFPKKANISIAEIISENEIGVRVWERGVGETDSCGSAACAVLVAAVRRNYIGRKEAIVKLQGGDLFIRWDENQHIIMTGKVSYVFSGIYNNSN